ncbi:hypothetical protein ACTHGU_21480 [Chitinophagaceae bacterium MMS25-I14]
MAGDQRKGMMTFQSKVNLQKGGQVDWNTTKEGIGVSTNDELKVSSAGGVNLLDHNPKKINKSDTDFMISFSLDKEETTVVPLGILDFGNNYENPYFSFRYTLSIADIDSLDFHIYDADGKGIYSMGYLKPVIISCAQKSILLINAKKEVPKLDTANPLKAWDYSSLFKKYALEEPDFTKVGSYLLNWDGFDNDGIYDSTRFNGKKLKASITAHKDSKQKTIELEFDTSYKEVDWVDVKIDRNKKRIDTTLRVDLKDGGEEGLECFTYHRMNPRDNETKTECPWDKIPADEIKKWGQPPITSRTKSFEQLKQLSIDGLKYHWGRNQYNTEGKNVKISNDSYEIFINPINAETACLNEVKLVYNTNGAWDRSGNPGVLAKISYNVGYILYSNGWGYQSDVAESEDFSFTSAHEIGHSILKAYGNYIYSWQHKGSSYLLPQDEKPTPDESGSTIIWGEATHVDHMPGTLGEYYPQAGEIDLMKYYHYEKDPVTKKSKYVPLLYRRSVAAEKDVLGLIWLTKIKIS